jgi:hypothetical protein
MSGHASTPRHHAHGLDRCLPGRGWNLRRRPADEIDGDEVQIITETIFGPTLTLSTGRIIPTRWVGEQHVKEDLGFIPSFADWVKAIRPEPWMGRSARIEALVDPHLASPVVEVA